MKRLFVLIFLSIQLVCFGFAQRKEIHIVGVNDMHASISAFPKFAAIVDSLRTLYPSLLVLSAGDNRTGDPLNDMYQISSYPMVTLMNMVGFDASTLGNHDFDVHSLPPLIGLSNFNYVCANISPSDKSGLHIVPNKFFDVDGVKVGIIGVVQVNAQGRPDTHPDNVKDVKFSSPRVAIEKQKSFSHQCDVTILLSHIGYEADCAMAKAFPWLDVIVGGHTHTQLSAEEPLHNGVLITQNKNKLPKVTHITLTLKNGRVIGKRAEYIDVKSFPHTNSSVSAMVDFFSNNSAFKRVIAKAEKPFKNKDELTFMMCDALLEEGQGDISVVNNGGCRLDSLAEGDITMRDVFAMDPFCNEMMEMELSGEDLLNLLTIYSRGSLYHLPRLGGICCQAIIDSSDKNKDRLVSISLKTLDGKNLDIHKTYKVVTSSYMTSVWKKMLNRPVQSMNKQTADVLTHFLERHETVNYENVSRMEVIEK